MVMKMIQLEPNYEDIKNENCHFEIYSSKFNKRLSYEEYLESNETEFYFNEFST